MFSAISSLSVRHLFRNVRYLFNRTLADDLMQSDLRSDVLFLKILNMSEPLASEYKEEIDFLRSNGLTPFPYEKRARLGAVTTGYDPKRSLPFVVHDGKRLYFPRSWTEARARRKYAYFIADECILGGGYRNKAPHQYEDGTACVRDNDVVVDIGAAEGLFALHAADRAARIILFESAPIWRAPLRATFEPYSSKVLLVNKRADIRRRCNSVCLRSFLAAETGASFFVKMDIEGAETILLESCREWLTDQPHVRLACSAYHRQNDAADLERLLSDMGFRTSFSDGYMVFPSDPRQSLPYFRRGVIRAVKPH